MTTDGGEPGLEVPVTTVGPQRRERRRAAIVAVVVVAVVGGAIALSRLDEDADAIAVLPTPTDSPAATDPTRRPTALPSPPQALATVANVPLLDSPTLALIVRSGTDAELFAWTPGEPTLELARTFPNAYDPAAEGQYVMLSPDGRYLASFSLDPSATVGADRIRLVNENGIQWEHPGITGDLGLAWWGGSRRLAVAGGPTTWVLAEIADDGGITGREVEVPAAPPEALESGGLAPVGFSTDGQSVIVGFFSEAARTVHAAYRLGFADGIAEPLATFPSAGPRGLTAEAQEFGFVDPIVGRTFTFPQFGDASEPPRLSVLAPDGLPVFEVDSRYVIRAMWDDAGRLAVLEGDHFDGPSPLRLLSVEQDGTTTALFETPLVARGMLLGVRDGYAGLAFQVDDPRRTQLVLVDMVYGLVSGIEATRLSEDEPNGAGWLP